jgi:hypothetical protein
VQAWPARAGLSGSNKVPGGYPAFPPVDKGRASAFGLTAGARLFHTITQRVILCLFAQLSTKAKHR